MGGGCSRDDQVKGQPVPPEPVEDPAVVEARDAAAKKAADAAEAKRKELENGLTPYHDDGLPLNPVIDPALLEPESVKPEPEPVFSLPPLPSLQELPACPILPQLAPVPPAPSASPPLTLVAVVPSI